MQLKPISWTKKAERPHNYWTIPNKNGHFGRPRYIYKDASNFDAGDTNSDHLIIMGLVITKLLLNSA